MKPQSILDGLETEPVVFLGCTWSELMKVVRKSVFVGLLATTIFAFILITFIKGIVLFVLSLVFFGLVSFFIAKINFKRISKLRADKPLFYEKHASTYKQKYFIQAQSIYQRERNCDTQKKKRANSSK